MTQLSQKDEQIARQSEEIESQRRKIESLERELQKFLDPDSGTIIPRFQPEKPRSKAEQYATYRANGGSMTMQEWENDSRYDPSLSGEAGLLQQIASLQKELADCLDPVDLTRNESLRDRIYSSIHALFLPAREWHKERKQMGAKFIPWWFLRQFFFDTDLFDDHWTSRDFRNGLDMLNDIVRIVDGDKPAVDLEHLEKYELGYRLFDYNPDEDQSKHRGMQALISALLLVRQNQDYPGIKGAVSDEALNDMLVTLKAITFYQRLWMDAKEEVSETK